MITNGVISIPILEYENKIIKDVLYDYMAKFSFLKLKIQNIRIGYQCVMQNLLILIFQTGTSSISLKRPKILPETIFKLKTIFKELLENIIFYDYKNWNKNNLYVEYKEKTSKSYINRLLIQRFVQLFKIKIKK